MADPQQMSNSYFRLVLYKRENILYIGPSEVWSVSFLAEIFNCARILSLVCFAVVPRGPS